MDLPAVLEWVLSPRPLGPSRQPSPAEWDELAAAALELDAGALLHSNARRRGDLALPPAALTETWRASHANNTAQALKLEHSAREVLTALAKIGVTAHPLKGAHLLLEGVLEDPGARNFYDIDLLTRREDRSRVLRALGHLGFAPDHAQEGPKHLPAMRRGAVFIEVHEWAYWDRRGRAVIAGDLDREPHPLARTAVHLLHHCFVSSPTTPWLVLKTLVDLARLREHLDRAGPHGWGRVRLLADDAGLSNELSMIESAIVAVEVAPPLELDARMLELLRPRTPSETRELGLQFLYTSLTRHPLWYRLATMRSMLLPSRGRMERRYGLPVGSPRVYLAYAWRALELGGRVVRRLRGSRR